MEIRNLNVMPRHYVHLFFNGISPSFLDTKINSIVDNGYFSSFIKINDKPISFNAHSNIFATVNITIIICYVSTDTEASAFGEIIEI